MTSPSCHEHGRHLSLERVVDAEVHPRTCRKRVWVWELACIGELVLVYSQSRMDGNRNEIRIFDLMTNLWRDDITLDLGGRELGSDLEEVLRRFRTLTPSLLGVVFYSDDIISIQQLGKDRRFTLLYTLNFGMIAKQMRFVDGFFISPATPNVFFFFGKCPLNLRRQRILEAAVGDIDRNDPQVRSLSSIQRIHNWDHSASDLTYRIFRHENNVYVVLLNEAFIFDCSTRQLSGVRDLGWQHFGCVLNMRQQYVTMLYELPSMWSNKRTSLIPSGNIRQEFEQASDIEWWSMKEDSNQTIQPSIHFCVSSCDRSSFTRADEGITLPSGDILFLGNSNSIYRIPARCFGKVKKLTELAKNALLAVIPVEERERIKGSVEDIKSLGTQVYAKFYS